MASEDSGKAIQETKENMRAVKGGAGDINYDENSYFQRSVVEELTPQLLATLPSLMPAYDAPSPSPQKVSVRTADFGCATGRNSLALTREVVLALRERFGDDALIFSFFSDLPSNDFNGLFQLLAEQLQQPPLCSPAAVPQEGGDARPAGGGAPTFFAAGVPGSFYRQLFPPGFLSLASCHNSLHWTSCDPVARYSLSNPGTIWYQRAASPAVHAAYKAQAKADLAAFLAARATELVPGGLLWIICLTDKDSKGQRNGSRWWLDLIEDSWRQLVEEGAVPASTLDDFNIPLYERSMDDISEGIEANGQFDVLISEARHFPLRTFPPGDPEGGYGEGDKGTQRSEDASSVTNFVRAVSDPIVEAAIGAELVGKLGDRMLALAGPRVRSVEDAGVACALVVLRKKLASS